MGERIWNDITLGPPLQSIVPNRGSGLHRCFSVARLDKLPFLLGAVRPLKDLKLSETGFLI